MFSAIFRRSGVTSTPCAAQFCHFRDEGMRVEDHAIADDRQLAAAHDAGRQQRQLVDLAVDDQRMAGIVAALEAHDDVGALRQPVDDLALALVAPLRADDHHIGHVTFPSESCGQRSRRAANRHASITASAAERDPSCWRADAPPGTTNYRRSASFTCRAAAAHRCATCVPSRNSAMHRTAYLLLLVDHPVLGRQRRRRQAGGRPCLADAADVAALGLAVVDPAAVRLAAVASRTGRSCAALPLLVALGACGFTRLQHRALFAR